MAAMYGLSAKFKPSSSPLAFCRSSDSVVTRVLSPAGGNWIKVKANRGSDNAVRVRARARARAQHTTAIGDMLLAGSKQVSSVELRGKVVLAKKAFLDAQHQDEGADLEDTAADLRGNKVDIRLVSVDSDPETDKPKVSAASSIRNWGRGHHPGEDEYPITFHVPTDFGEPGALLVTNNHPNEFLLTSLSIELPDSRTIHFLADSVVFNASKYSGDRIFFSNKTYLPAHTPAGIKALREEELRNKRGDGTGERQFWDRVYDYDVYNDLSRPDSDPSTIRPVLGNSQDRPYPRRIRTGRPPSKPDPRLESEQGNLSLERYYIPRDEMLSREEASTVLLDAVKAAVQSVIPAIHTFFDTEPDEFDSFQDLNSLYSRGINLEGCIPESEAQQRSTWENPSIFLREFMNADGDSESLLKYPQPQVIRAHDAAWCSDEEFGRQTVAGMNPLVLELVREYPPKSALDVKVFGPATALTDDHILPHLEGLTVAQAISAKRLFKVDYHDLVLPFIHAQNTEGDGKGYAPRSILFLSSKGSLRVIAIELALPPGDGKETGSVRVFTAQQHPSDDWSKKDWLWELAKIHANTVDFGFHELVSHWLESHAVMEPIIVATHRQLSAMHPVFVLLQPAFRNTMNINGAARQALVCAGGIIERSFTPGKLCMEMSSAVYGARWRFDRQALPQNLISRGLAEQADEGCPGGVKLVIEDYPFAKDGLELWDVLHRWTSEYVKVAYKGSDAAVRADTELQTWWKEIVEVGHGDKKEASWWPKLDSVQSLAHTLTTIAWIAGPHHAAVNFGQFAYAGYPLNRPSQTRKLIPEEGSPEHQLLLANPEAFVLASMSNKVVATTIMTTIQVLSTHSTDEEYLGQRRDSNWTCDPAVKAAFHDLGRSIKQLEKNIVARNRDPALTNRRGPAEVPYTLLYPSSTSGMTGQGVPSSTSI